MARRLMTRRGNSASQPQVTPYQQIELDDGWREWENTKQELVLVKRQLAKKDALIVQLKTASRRLQETLRKKDKDLQAAFAILRSPQDAKTTKTRKQELVDRLVSECMQRAATSEALAEERRRELDRLKYSSKFLRFQELEIEIEECHMEIERLRAKLETTSTSSPTAIVGKVKVSSVHLPANGSESFTGSLMKKTKLDPLKLPENDSPDNKQTIAPTNMSATRTYSSQHATGQVRVVPLAKYDRREGFVSKTRRRALEAEYYKQVRLAQLEVECELEENLHIRAAREAKRLEAIEHKSRQAELKLHSARSQQAALDVTQENDDPISSPGAKGGYAVDGDPDIPQQENPPSQRVNESEVKNADTADKEVANSYQAIELDVITEQAEAVEKGVSEEPAVNVIEDNDEEGGGHHETDRRAQPKQKMYEDDEFDACDDGKSDNLKETGPGGVDYSIWNVDPDPYNKDQPDRIENNDAEYNQPAGSNYYDEDSTKPAVWNADPSPPSSHEEETKSEGGAVWNADPNPLASIGEETRGEGGAVWNVDPRTCGSDASKDDAPVVYSDNEDDSHDAAVEQEGSMSSEDNNASSAWNLDPNPSVPTDEKVTDAETSYEAEVQTGMDSVKKEGPNAVEDDSERKVWNHDPTPSSDPGYIATGNAGVSETQNSGELDQPVWNLDPDLVAEAVSSPGLPDAHNDAKEVFLAEAADNSEEENANADSVDPSPPDSIPATDPTVDNQNGESPWNLDPSSSRSTADNNNVDIGPTQNVDLPVQDVTSTGELSAGAENAQVEPDHDAGDNDAGTNNAWNLDPSVATSPSERYDEGDRSPIGEEGNERIVWNLDPQTGDASEPTDTATEVATSELVQEDEESVPPQMTVDEHPVNAIEDGFREEKETESSTEPGAPTFVDARVLEPAGHYTQASNPSSYRESEDDATPEYTPPSTAHDSDAAGDDDDDDTTW